LKAVFEEEFDAHPDSAMLATITEAKVVLSEFIFPP
jgi:hypothetical protein